MNQRQTGIIEIVIGSIGILVSGYYLINPPSQNSLKPRQELHQICLQAQGITITESRIAMHEIMALDYYPDFEKDPELKTKMKDELLEYETKYAFWDRHTSRLVHLCTIDPERFERDYSGITSCKDFVNRYNTLNRDLKSINPLELCI